MKTNQLRPLLTRVVSVRMDDRLFARLNRHADLLDISATTLARRIIRRYFISLNNRQKSK